LIKFHTTVPSLQEQSFSLQDLTILAELVSREDVQISEEPKDIFLAEHGLNNDDLPVSPKTSHPPKVSETSDLAVAHHLSAMGVTVQTNAWGQTGPKTEPKR